MRTSGTTDGTTVQPLTKRQKAACNIFMGVMLVGAGVIIALAGGGVINAPVGDIAAATVLFAVGAGVLFSAVVAKNSVSMWLAGVLLFCGLPSLLAAVTTATYYNLFPLYIAAPAGGCALAAIYAEARLPCAKCALFFGVLAVLFSLASSGVCGWGLAGGLVAAFCGVCVIIYAVRITLRKDVDNA